MVFHVQEKFLEIKLHAKSVCKIDDSNISFYNKHKTQKENHGRILNNMKE